MLTVRAPKEQIACSRFLNFNIGNGELTSKIFDDCLFAHLKNPIVNLSTTKGDSSRRLLTVIRLLPAAPIGGGVSVV